MRLRVRPRRDRELSEARAWREDGVYTLRSTEFDVIAEDEDFDGRSTSSSRG